MGNKKQKWPASVLIPPETDLVSPELERLSNFSLTELRAAWIQYVGSEAPPIQSRDLILRMLARLIQEQAFGGPDATTRNTLRGIAGALERDGDYTPKIRHDLSPGVVLTREWKGVAHKVTVTADGFQHLGKRYKSLSDIARTITNTRWSGPRFFGLEQKRSRPVQQTES